MTFHMNTKAFGCDLTVKADAADQGIFKGYASTHDVDRGDDIVVKGAFGQLNPKKVRMLWQHNSSEPIGRWDVMREDAKGLYVEGKLILKTRRGREAYELMKEGALNEMSIGYKALEHERGNVGGKTVRRLKKLDLFEVSLVSMAMNPHALVDDVKSVGGRFGSAADYATEREFERALRDAGLSRKMAQLMVAEGLDGVSEHLAAVMREAASLSCKDSRIILSDGYREFLKYRADLTDDETEDDDSTPQSRDGGDSDSTAEEKRNSVNQRDADGEPKSSDPKSLTINPAVLAAINLSLAISGD